MTDWSRYAACETCDALEGRPCRDLRYSRSWGSHEFNTDEPHPGRPRKRLTGGHR